VLPWPPGEADRAAESCFQGWLATRGCDGPIEIRNGIAQVKQFLEAHGSSRFEAPWEELGQQLDDDCRAVRTINRAGFRRRNSEGNWEYFILPETWRNEVCKGFNATAIAREMIARRWLEPGEDNNLAKKVAVPGHRKPRLYCINATFFDGSEL
jgi:putative DNA primase/helicase